MFKSHQRAVGGWLKSFLQRSVRKQFHALANDVELQPLNVDSPARELNSGNWS
jgi:hypothetical protein